VGTVTPLAGERQRAERDFPNRDTSITSWHDLAHGSITIPHILAVTKSGTERADGAMTCETMRT